MLVDMISFAACDNLTLVGEDNRSADDSRMETLERGVAQPRTAQAPMGFGGA